MAGLRGGWRGWEGCPVLKRGTHWLGRAVTPWERSLCPKAGAGDSRDTASLCCILACWANKPRQEGGKVGQSPSIPQDLGDHRA